MSTPAPARTWRAACPNCGAPVDFRSAASASAVCGFCRSTLVREGEALRKIGTSAEIFDDFTPLQIGAAGRFQGVAFMLVGRLQLGTDDGPWNEWHALFDNGRHGWLSEDNGRYVFAFDAPAPAGAPPLQSLRAGMSTTLDGRAWRVASVVQARLIAAEGELVRPPPADRPLPIADLRNTQDEVGTLEASDPARLQWSVGKSVRLADLQLSGLREAGAPGTGGAGEKTLKAQAPACPNCGAPLKISLSTSQSVVCDSCKAVVDLSQGIGPDMAHYAQMNPHEPALPLGRSGTLPIPSGAAALAWQIVGYVERMELMGDGDEAEAWREYLLYNPGEGFAFLVDSNSGWSVVRVLTGVPELRGDQARWYGLTYQRRWTYASVTTYVLGEFYWRVQANQRTEHEDYEASASGHRALLSLERTPTEATWSAGESIPAEMVAAIFGVAPQQRARLAREPEAGPPSLNTLVGPGRLISWPMLLILLVLVLIMLAMCGHDPCRAEKRAFGANSAEYQQCSARSSAGTGFYSGTGGAWGGYSSGGGGHK